jgi:hypothetical protein
MPYSINRYNGTLFTTVEDGTINTVTELKFVGKNYAGYGEAQNENMLHLLENFANETPPAKPISGMIWFDVLTNKIKYYDGATWRTPGGAIVDPAEPIQAFEGDIWWNSLTNQMFARSASGDWVLIGPQSTEFGTTQLVSRTVKDISGVEHSIIEALITNEDQPTKTVFIVSTTEFILDDNENLIEGFSLIRPGVNLPSRADTGINYGYWGIAEDSEKLGGIPAADYQQKSAVYAVPETLTVGNSLVVYMDLNTAVIENVLPSSNVEVRIEGNTILNINETGLIPETDNEYDIGAPDKRWRTIYAVNVDGSTTRADSLLVNGNVYLTGSVDPIPDTIAARDNAGNLRANLFQGTATTARYADLAEKYTTDSEYSVGTAMAVCLHDDHETCAAGADDVCIGVISAEPAYLMNSEIEGQAIGLKGRVPVRVLGPVKKGQSIYALNAGVCSTLKTTAFVGVALETNLEEDEKLIECVLKV